jgi:SAM-dependent methyltransferase
MIISAAGERIKGTILENGCGVGVYLENLHPLGGQVIGLEYDFSRAARAKQKSNLILGGAGEQLPFPENTFNLILSNEVIEHVMDDQLAIQEMIRTLKPGGRLILFCPNRWYPVETHGIYWRGRYRFGNIPLVNYLPRRWRNRLAPHVRAYTQKDLEGLFRNLPILIIQREVIFGGYDNIVNRCPRFGRWLRDILYLVEKTPVSFLGLSHLWIVEKIKGSSYD